MDPTWQARLAGKFGEKEESGAGIAVAIVIGVLVFLSLVGVGLYFALRKPEPVMVTTPPPPPTPAPPPAETDEQKKARETKEAAEKAAALTAETTAKEQEALDADIKSAADRLVNIPYEVNQLKTAFDTYETSKSKAKTHADLIAALKIVAEQHERAIFSAGWGTYLANAIETRAKVLKKDTDATVKKTITDLRNASKTAFDTLKTFVGKNKDKKGCYKHITQNSLLSTDAEGLEKSQIVCPDKFSTYYNYGVNGAADCPTPDSLCNRCIGFEFPKPPGGRDGQWNDRKWEGHTGTSSGPLPPGQGSVMSYSGIYVVDGMPADSQACT